MSYLTKEELKTHMNVDNIDVITENDDTIVQAAIDGAISEAKGYLSLFNISTIFAATGSNRNSLLLTFVKDISVWHLMVLSNYQADVKFRQDRYERAVAWLKSIQRGDVVPDLPRATDDSGAISTPIKLITNPKRIQHF